jgi:hypothetical protein
VKSAAFRQKQRQRVPGILIRAHEAVRYFEAAKQVVMRAHEFIKPREVFPTRNRRRDNPPRAGFQVHKDPRFSERKFDFISIQDLEDQNLMALKAELLKPQQHFFGGLQQVGKKQNYAPAMDQPGGVLEQVG